MQAVACAGFSKRGGAGNLENLRITNTRIKTFYPFICPKSENQLKTKIRSLPKFSVVFGPKLGKDQKHRSSPTVCALKPSAQVRDAQSLTWARDQPKYYGFPVL